MDGVLIEAKDWHYEALNQALGLFGLKISRYEHFITYDGLPTKKKLELLSIERNLPRELHEFVNEIKQQYTMEIINKQCKPKFYHEYALSKLYNAGYKLAVCSNSTRNTVEIMMEKSALNKYLSFYLSNQDVTRSKPDPEIYNTAILRLGLTPEECLIIEDNENGVKAAKQSGAHVMVVSDVEDVNYQNISKYIECREL